MDVVCLGILVADIFASPIDSLPAAGELRPVDRYQLSAGGCAANTAACLRRLGRKVRVVGKVGEDLFGDFVKKDLERLGVDTFAVRRSSTHPTSNTYIVNVRGEDRRFLHSIGANADFRFEDIDLATLDGARVLYVGGYMVMPDFGPQHLAQLFREAKGPQDGAGCRDWGRSRGSVGPDRAGAAVHRRLSPQRRRGAISDREE